VQIATPEQIDGVRREFENACRRVPQANAAGVRLLVGDDYAVLSLPHGAYAKELEFYVKDLGVAPLEVLRWATKHGAEAMGRGAEIGTLAPGKLADLVVVDGDPSADIALLQNAQKIRAVLKGGRFVRDALEAGV
jgi:imidazolonepropionase-like amidohydrolase